MSAIFSFLIQIDNVILFTQKNNDEDGGIPIYVLLFMPDAYIIMLFSATLLR